MKPMLMNLDYWSLVNFLEFEDNAKALEIELHKKAKYFLENELKAAWKTLLSFNN